MDTPERIQIGTQISKFEDSPVFNFINSLSPIKPVKSTHVTQTLNSLSFSSLPSVFTSPHVTSQKDSKFFRRHTIADPTKPLVSSDKVGVDRSEEILYANQPCENASCSSPRGDPTSYCGIEAEAVLALAESSTTHVPYNLIVSEQRLLEGERDLQGICKTGKKGKETECDWESLITNATGLVKFYSPNETNAYEGTLYISQDQEGNNDLHKSQLGDPIYPCEVPKTEDPSTQPEEVRELNDVNQKPGKLSSTSTRFVPTSNPSEGKDNETVSNLHCGLRRRCLVFEMGGAHMKNFINSSTSSSSMVSQCDEEIASTDYKLVPMKAGGKLPRRKLPEIGLHLNALTQTPKNRKVVKHETLAIGEQLDVHNSSRVHSPITGETALNNLLIPASCENDTNLHGNDIQGDQEALQAPSEIAPEDSEQISPKKRRRFEQVGENEGCKRCNCKKSKCLKLYCECFAAGVCCTGPCSCQECFNKPAHEETILATRKQIEIRNPLAFAPKVISASDSIPDSVGESNQTPASARHKRGCNCKKSGCLKKYCECYQSGVGCSINCRCESCKNAFGTKDGYCQIETEAGPDEEETLGLEKTEVNKDLRKPLIQNNDEQNAASAHPSTPLHLSRVSTQLPFSSKSKLQRSFTIGSSIGLQHCPKLTNANFLRPQPKFEKNIRTTPKENDIPENLQTNSTPISGIQSSSPNSKRVSPPQSHSNFGSSSSPGRRSSRKLILQSIPSFPSLNSQP